MRKVATVTAFITVLISGHIEAGAAGWGDGPGCGLGKMVFENQPKSILSQHVGSTLNVPSQPFAITSGTSGCTNNGMIVKHEAVHIFVSQNVGHVSQDMAKGQGEYLSSLATLMGIPSDRHAEFFALAQDLFRDMMEGQEAGAATVDADDAPRAVVIALREAMVERPVAGNAQANR